MGAKSKGWGGMNWNGVGVAVTQNISKGEGFEAIQAGVYGWIDVSGLFETHSVKKQAMFEKVRYESQESDSWKLKNILNQH